MSSQVDGPTRTFLAGAALEPFRRVKMDAAAETVVYAGAAEACIGVTQKKAASGEKVAVRLLGRGMTCKVEASEALLVNAVLYGAANGKVKDTADGTAQGTALAAASGDGSVIEVLFDNGNGGQINGASLLNVADGGNGVPFEIIKAFPDAATGDVEIYNANAPFKFRVIDAVCENRANNGANANTVQVCAAAAGATAISDAMSLNAKVDTDIVRAAKIDDANGTVAAGGSLYLRVTKVGGTVGGEVRIKCLRVA